MHRAYLGNNQKYEYTTPRKFLLETMTSAAELAHLFHGSTDDAAEDVAVVQVAAALWQLYKVCKGVVFQNLHKDRSQICHGSSKGHQDLVRQAAASIFIKDG